jgi:hypothetical protein
MGRGEEGADFVLFLFGEGSARADLENVERLESFTRAGVSTEGGEVGLIRVGLLGSGTSRGRRDLGRLDGGGLRFGGTLIVLRFNTGGVGEKFVDLLLFESAGDSEEVLLGVRHCGDW